MNRVLPRLLLLSTAAAFVIVCAPGCKFKPEHDMAEQPSAHPPYKPSEAFENGSTARVPPPGTLARIGGLDGGTLSADLAPALPVDTSSAGETAVIPFPITPEVLARGQQRFEIYCVACHGRLGDGNGMIVQRGLTPPPSFHIDRLRAVSDGHLYNVITNGYGQMFSYNDRVRPVDRWMIAAYVRALQATTADPQRMAALNEQERQRLEGRRP